MSSQKNFIVKFECGRYLAYSGGMAFVTRFLEKACKFTRSEAAEKSAYWGNASVVSVSE